MSEDKTSVSEEDLSFKCVFCLKEIVESNEPKLMPCLHSACNKCLLQVAPSTKNETTQEGLTCPSCKQDFTISKVVDHIFLLESVQANDANQSAKAQNITCTSCDDKADALSFCVECHECLCKTCLQAHQRVKMTKDHIVQSLQDLEANKIAVVAQKHMYCSAHKQEKLKLFCESCETLTCRDCQLEEHKDHKYKFVSDACQEQKKMLNNLLMQISKKKVFLDKACELVAKRHTEIEDKEQAVKREIKNFAVRFINEINAKGKLLLQELNTICENKKKQLTTKTEELNAHLQKLKYCQTFTELAMNQGSEIALLYCKKPVYNRLYQLLQQNCDIPNPKYKLDIRFNYDAEAVSEYIRTIGGFIVDQQPVSTPSQSTSDSSCTQSVTNSPSSPSVTISSPSQTHTTGNETPLKQLPSSTIVTVSTPPEAFKPTSPIVIRPEVLATSPPSATTIIGQARPIRPPETQYIHVRTVPETQYIHVRNGATQLRPPAPVNSIQLASSGITIQSVTSHQSLPPQRAFRPRVPVPATIYRRFPAASSYGAPTPSTVRLPSTLYPNTVFRFGDAARSATDVLAGATVLGSTKQANSVVTSPPLILPHSLPTHAGAKRIATDVANISVKRSPSHPTEETKDRGPLGDTPLSPKSTSGGEPITARDKEKLALAASGDTISLNSSVDIIVKKEPEDAFDCNSPQGTIETNAVSKTQVEMATNGSKGNTSKEPDAGKEHPRDSASTRPACLLSPPNVLKVNRINLEGVKGNGMMLLENTTFSQDSLETANSPSSTASGSSQNTPTSNSEEDSSKNPKKLQILVQDVYKHVLPTSRKRKSSGDSNAASKVSCPSNPLGQIRTHRRFHFRKGASKHDVSEDWCAVCHDGGELLCCGKCPRVYHLGCHVPSLSTTPNNDWVCILCRDDNSVVLSNEREREREYGNSKRSKSPVGLHGKQQMICEKILMELFCHELSYPFHHPVSRMVPNYHKVITKPMDFTTIKLKLSPHHFNHYANVDEFLDDVRLVFDNCCKYNPTDSQLHATAESLNKFLEDLLYEFLADYVKKKKSNKNLQPDSDKSS